MKKSIISIILLGVYFSAGFGMVFAENLEPLPVVEIPDAPKVVNVDVTGNGNGGGVTPSDANYWGTSNGYLPAWGGGSSYGSNGAGGVNRNMLQVGGGNNSANGDTNVTFRDNFLRNIQVYIMGLLGIVTVSVFLYIWYMLFTAQGKEEDFKKAWSALTYAVIGLAVIPLAYIAVKIVTGFTF